MKFLGSIETFSQCDFGVELYIPIYHRTSLGLFENTKVYAYPQWKKFNGRDIKEIIISPFQPNSWDSIWKMELSMPDAPGLISSITDVLFRKNININIEESIISNSSTDFHVFLIADFEKYDYGENGINVNDKVNHVQKSLQNELDKLGKEIKISSLSKIEFLANKLRDDESDVLNKQSIIEYRSKELKPLTIKSNTLTITKSLFADLRLINDEGSILNDIQCSILSDSEDKYLLIRIIEENEKMAFIDITHSNKLGAIHRFSSLIYNISLEKPLNLVNCYNRVKDINTTCHWYALIDATANPPILETLFEQLSRIPEIDDVQLKVIDYSIGLRKLKVPHLRPPIRSEISRIRQRSYQIEYIRRIESDLEEGKISNSRLFDKNSKLERKLRLYKQYVFFLSIPSIIYIIAVLLLNYMNADENVKEIYHNTATAFAWLIGFASSIFGIITFVESRRRRASTTL